MFARFVSLSIIGLAIGCGEGEPDGEALWDSKCAVCHSADGSGNTTNPDIRQELFSFSVDDIVSVIQNGTENMPPITTLSDDEATAVATWAKENLGADTGEE